jgi:hypothetical protein
MELTAYQAREDSDPCAVLVGDDEVRRLDLVDPVLDRQLREMLISDEEPELNGSPSPLTNEPYMRAATSRVSFWHRARVRSIRSHWCSGLPLPGSIYSAAHSCWRVDAIGGCGAPCEDGDEESPQHVDRAGQRPEPADPRDTDAAAVAILRRCREAMAGAGKLLVVEPVLRPGDEPDPATFSDLNMLVMVGGRERSADDFGRLYAAAGFALTRIIPTGWGYGIIEGAPA